MGEECEIKKSEQRRKANKSALAGLQSRYYTLWSIIRVLCLKMKNTFGDGGRGRVWLLGKAY